MIRVEDLREAIAECEGSRNPNSSTCIKLAAYYAILNQMTNNSDNISTPVSRSYSFASAPVITFGNSDFSRLIEEKGIERCFPILEEVADALYVIEPKLYRSMMRKLEEL